ncbi:MAG: hypothetical protein Kow0075_10270 [Salibacteraceae bacterium]
MRINELVFWIADLIEATFPLLRFLGNTFNWMIIAVMFVLAVIWIKAMADYNREAERNGTLK